MRVILEIFPVGPLQCNCSIVADENTREAMVIDPGDEIDHILARLSALGLTLKQVVITHAHIDHVGGAARLKRVTGAVVLLNQNDDFLLKMMDTQAAWLGIAPPEIVSLDGSADDLSMVGLATIPAQVLHTPGHTPGSICLHLASEQLLFSGDTLFAGTIGRTDLPGGDSKLILRSLRERLLPLPDRTRVVPGHGRETVMGEERERNPFLQPGIRF
jgi:glyoxylase-like metal-dependent hydrolase (beta-lactamase superfamily II)